MTITDWANDERGLDRFPAVNIHIQGTARMLYNHSSQDMYIEKTKPSQT